MKIGYALMKDGSSAGAVEKIKSGAMTGTVKQDGEAMAGAIAKIASNYLSGISAFDGIDKDMVLNNWKVNIPYSLYTGEEA